MKEHMYYEANLSPKMYVFENCVNIISTLPRLVHSETIHEDIEKRNAEDYLVNAMGHLLMHTYQLRSLKQEKDEKTLLEEECIGEEEIVDWGEGV